MWLCNRNVMILLLFNLLIKWLGACSDICKCHAIVWESFSQSFVVIIKTNLIVHMFVEYVRLVRLL